jgi:hypothetical protein
LWGGVDVGTDKGIADVDEEEGEEEGDEGQGCDEELRDNGQQFTVDKVVV